MKVIASAAGFYGGRRIQAGQEFDVPDDESGSWFSPPNGKEAATGSAPSGRRGGKKSEPTTLADITAQDAGAIVATGSAELP